jgi:hypothetical protein
VCRYLIRVIHRGLIVSCDYTAISSTPLLRLLHWMNGQDVADVAANRAKFNTLLLLQMKKLC